MAIQPDITFVVDPLERKSDCIIAVTCIVGSRELYIDIEIDKERC